MTFSSSQIYFFICAALMICLLLVCLWVGMKGLFQERKEFETEELNRYVYSDELAELQRDLNRGSITRAQFEEGKEELERRALEEANYLDAPVKSHPKEKLFFLGLGVLIPISAIVIYLYVGNPSLIGYHIESEKSHWNERGEVFFDENAPLEEDKLREYLKESPKDVRGWLTLARLLNQKKKPDEALQAFNKAFSLSNKISEDPDSVLERALTMLETGKPENYSEAKKELSRVIEMNSGNVRPYEVLGILCFNEGKYEEAAKYWTEALGYYPENSATRSYLLDVIGEAKNRASLNFTR